MSSAVNPDRQRPVSTPLLAVLGGVAVVAIAYAVYTFAFAGDDTAVADDLALAPPPPAASEPVALSSEVATENPSEIADGGVEPTFEVFDARDPFEQLVADGGGSGGGFSDGVVDGAAPAAATQPSDGQPQAPLPPVAGGTQPTGSAPTSTPPADGEPSQTTVGGTTILLDDVFTKGGTKTALVVVDNEGYEATAGETVAGDVTVLDIAGNCATMRYEDRRFILCEGEQIQK